MNFIKSWGLKLRNYGAEKAIDALVLLQPTLAQKIESAKAEVALMDSNQMSSYLIAEAQDALRQHFNIPKK